MVFIALGLVLSCVFVFDQFPSFFFLSLFLFFVIFEPLFLAMWVDGTVGYVCTCVCVTRSTLLRSSFCAGHCSSSTLRLGAWRAEGATCFLPAVAGPCKDAYVTRRVLPLLGGEAEGGRPSGRTAVVVGA